MNDVQYKQAFKKNLNRLVKSADMKKETLSRLTGASTSQVTRWLNGDLIPAYIHFERLLQIFGVDDVELLGDSVSPNAYAKRFKQK